VCHPGVAVTKNLSITPTSYNRLEPEMKDLDHVHIYEPAIHLMSTYVAHAVAWLVQNGLPSLSWGHPRAAMLGKISYTSTCQTQMQHAGVDGAVEGQNTQVACPHIGCGMPASE
jgi:hypothetical protein